jgi:hypothetical protein
VRHRARGSRSLSVDHGGLDDVELRGAASQEAAAVVTINDEAGNAGETAPPVQVAEIEIDDRSVDLHSDDPREAVEPRRERIAAAADADDCGAAATAHHVCNRGHIVVEEFELRRSADSAAIERCLGEAVDGQGDEGCGRRGHPGAGTEHIGAVD